MAGKTIFTLKQIKEEFEKYGFELVEKDYKNIHTLMRFVCPKHSKYETKTTFNYLRKKNGKVCPFCNRSKLCIEDIRSEFAKRGYTLLETEYKGAKQKLKYRCPKHPNKDLSITFGNFKSGKKGCPYCSNNVKYTIDEAKEAFYNVGLELLESKYFDVFTKMKCRCPKHPGKDIKKTLKSILNGSGCPYCLEKGRKPTANYEEVKELFKSKGLILMEETYKSSTQKLRYKCPKHPDKELYKKYSELKTQTFGCPYCGNSAKLEFDFVKEEFEKKGFELIDINYINRNTVMDIKCKKHPDKNIKASYDMLTKNYACPYCNGYVDIEDIKIAFLERGLVLLETEYKDSATSMKYYCIHHPEKFQYKSWNNFKAGKGCYYCSNSRKLEYNEVKTMFQKSGYILKEKKYINSTTPMLFTCSMHPEKQTYTTLQNFNAGLLKGYSPCQYCNGKVDYEDVVKEFEKEGYELLEEEYHNATYPMKYLCMKHNDKVQLKTWSDFNKGSRCIYCRIEARKGSGAAMWKGGITSLSKYLRSLINEWKESTLKKYEYKCFITGRCESELEIHHSKPFHKIRDEILTELKIPIYRTVGEYTDDELYQIEKILIEKHEKYEGVPLKKELHKLFHRIYTYNVKEKDLHEFKDRYLKGEFQSGFKQEMRTRSFKPNPWTKDEDCILLERVSYYKEQQRPKKWGFQSAAKTLDRHWTACKKRYYAIRKNKGDQV
ncbi:transcription elongation factor Elf1 [Aquibacillus albus]|uniref:Transcription elongation factor Elf1 n=1 Tax=Aquibacillus albus TaxID=1168171 RepID=A0ABS2N087_9BACI|nr:transcription elongation factor Elf1 [Aquibacillus albus]